jgi:hypothetical protein
VRPLLRPGFLPLQQWVEALRAALAREAVGDLGEAVGGRWLRGLQHPRLRPFQGNLGARRLQGQAKYLQGELPSCLALGLALARLVRQGTGGSRPSIGGRQLPAGGILRHGVQSAGQSIKPCNTAAPPRKRPPP